MSIRFSRVKAVAGSKSAIFLVGGVPLSGKDLNKWTAFKEFISGLEENTPITISVETFLYGGEEPFDATPEEVAYIYKRLSMRTDFIEKRTEQCADSEFEIKL